MTAVVGTAPAPGIRTRPDLLRIAMIGSRGLPATWGGVEHHVEEIGARLVERGHEVTVFCRPGYADRERQSYRGMRLRSVPTVHGKGIEALVHSINAARRTLAGGYDVVHFHCVGPGIAAPLPRFLSHSAIVQTVHGLDADRAKWGTCGRLVLRMGTWMSAHVPDETVTVSHALQEHYLAKYHTSAVYVPNGVPEAPRVPESLLRRRFGLEPRSYLLFVGRLVPEKGPDLLLEAVERLPGGVRLVVAGGSSDTESFVGELRRRLSGRVVMPGYVFGDDLAALYTHALRLVLPSRLEGLPLTLLEAISYDLPVIVSDIAPHTEVVGPADRPGVRVFRSGSASALSAALLRSLADDDAELRGAVTTRRLVLDRYDWSHITDETESVYYRAMSGARFAQRYP
jgi:glycosyltransferase involved in cell wall biosynthesis